MIGPATLVVGLFLSPPINRGDFGVTLVFEILTYAKYAAVSHTSQALNSSPIYWWRGVVGAISALHFLRVASEYREIREFGDSLISLNSLISLVSFHNYPFCSHFNTSKSLVFRLLSPLFLYFFGQIVCFYKKTL